MTGIKALVIIVVSLADFYRHPDITFSRDVCRTPIVIVIVAWSTALKNSSYIFFFVIAGVVACILAFCDVAGFSPDLL